MEPDITPTALTPFGLSPYPIILSLSKEAH
jgi:hypothetical protein